MINTIELFAGVGGFHLGFREVNKKAKKKLFNVVWSNQWEPSTNIQHASIVYKEQFKDCIHSSEDIAKVIENNFDDIPPHDLLVGGFPCQDYSVARTLNNAGGIRGKKGVLWWSIHAILAKKGKNAPKYLMLENVDRLLKSPSNQRGRDFAIMLASLSSLGYAVEWRVINAAEYGFSQRRKRVYIMAYRDGTVMNKTIKKLAKKGKTFDWVSDSGIMNDAFPMSFENSDVQSFNLEGALDEISENTKDYDAKRRPFANAGVMIDRQVISATGIPPELPKSKIKTLRSILQKEKYVPEEFYISKGELEKWGYLKGAKKEERTHKSGFTYKYSEGPVTFPDNLDKPSRTIVTGEGGKGASRFKHVIEPTPGVYRRLTPLELEKLNGFSGTHTKHEKVSDTKRAFFMGNALVVGVVEKLGKSLADRAD